MIDRRGEMRYGLDDDGKRYYWGFCSKGVRKKYIDETHINTHVV